MSILRKCGRALHYIFFVIANKVKQSVELFGNRNNKKRMPLPSGLGFFAIFKIGFLKKNREIRAKSLSQIWTQPFSRIIQIDSFSLRIIFQLVFRNFSYPEIFRFRIRKIISRNRSCREHCQTFCQF